MCLSTFTGVTLGDIFHIFSAGSAKEKRNEESQKKKYLYSTYRIQKKQQQHYRSKGKELAGRIGTTGKKKSG